MTIDFLRRKYRIKQPAGKNEIMLLQWQASGKYKEIYREAAGRELTAKELRRRGLELADAVETLEAEEQS